jgi:hypothetical protein
VRRRRATRAASDAVGCLIRAETRILRLASSQEP